MNFFPIPMQTLFDVDHWNSFSIHQGHHILPMLVDDIDGGDTDCWVSFQKNPSSRAEIVRRVSERQQQQIHNDNRRKDSTKKHRGKKLQSIVSPLTMEVINTSGYLLPIKNETFDYLVGIRPSKPRKINLLPAVERCKNPYVIGGGKASGVLWNMWDKMQQIATGPLSEGNAELISATHQALKPHPTWRNVAHQCIRHHLQEQAESKESNDGRKSLFSSISQEKADHHTPSTSPKRSMLHAPSYLALHARVSTMKRCSKDYNRMHPISNKN
jgi:hypothetical protein